MPAEPDDLYRLGTLKERILAGLAFVKWLVGVLLGYEVVSNANAGTLTARFAMYCVVAIIILHFVSLFMPNVTKVFRKWIPVPSEPIPAADIPDIKTNDRAPIPLITRPDPD